MNPLLEPNQVTHAPHGHILTNTAVWSPDSQWIVYDIRSDLAGSIFDGTRIERVHVATGKVEVLYESQHGACCGVVTYHSTREEVVFILGPENPTRDWQYSACHRQGVVVSTDKPHAARFLDARDVVPPFTPGALRGGSHVHVHSRDGNLVSFTYDDHLLTERGQNTRNVGVAIVDHPVSVPHTHPRNHDGSAFTVLLTQTIDNPRPGSDEISRAYEDAWVGNRRIAFLGGVVSEIGTKITELFLVELPEDLTKQGIAPLAGTESTLPSPPRGTSQRRLTYTTDRKYPGVQGPRHWPRSSPDGNRIAFLMRDDAGIAQLWTISVEGTSLQQITQFEFNIDSAFCWHPDGMHVALIADKSVWIVHAATGHCRRLTTQSQNPFAPRSEACVISPDGQWVAYVQPVACGDAIYNQIFVVPVAVP